MRKLRGSAGRAGVWLLGAVLLVLAAGGVSVLRVARDGGSLATKRPSKPQTAPDFDGIHAWINSPPLTIPSLNGKVVLVDFWTYSCINCVRTLPILRALYGRYKAAGLEIVGIHAPEFKFEMDESNVRDAVRRLNVTWPVAMDNRMLTWRAYRNQYWPHVYLIDRAGVIRFDHIGEGDDVQTELELRTLLAERGPSSLPSPVNPSEPSFDSDMTPEIYAGYERGEQLDTIASAPGYSENQAVRYSAPSASTLARATTDGQIFLSGTWRSRPEFLQAETPGTIFLPFRAKNVYFVASAKESARATLRLDGKPIGPSAGDDVKSGSATVSRSDLFWIVKLSAAGRHVLEIDAEPGFQLYTFTFG
ncbi:MAG: redoxin domain-containing protein [Actinomycetota bacterium]|nr:redoxin domain-containing protein [Actinomycetota bacterium]